MIHGEAPGNPSGHTLKSVDEDLEALRALTLKMGQIACQQVCDACRALVENRPALASMVLRREDWVDALEVEADDRLVAFLVKHEPRGPDLRTLLALGKSAREFERIGDEAQRLATTAIELYRAGTGQHPGRELMRDVEVMSELSISLVRSCLTALSSPSVDQAMVVSRGGDKLSGQLAAGLRRLVTFVMEDARNVGHVVALALALRCLERVAEHAQNVGEHVIYQVRGKDVKHLGTAAEIERALENEPS